MNNSIIKAIRIKEQNPIIVSYLFGILDSSIRIKENLNLILLHLLIFILISFFSFFINEYSDKDTDFFRTDKLASKLTRHQYFIVFILFTLVISILISFVKFKIILISTFILGILYSLPEVRLKKYFPYDQITLGLVFVVFPYITPYILINSPINYITLLFLIVYLGNANLIAVAKDIDSDKSAKLKNLGVIFSFNTIMKIGIFNSVLSFILGFIIQNKYNYYWYYFINVFIMLLFYIFYKGFKNQLSKQKLSLISSSKRGVQSGWILVLLLTIIILVRLF